jgi:hypothetical protein
MIGSADGVVNDGLDVRFVTEGKLFVESAGQDDVDGRIGRLRL